MAIRIPRGEISQPAMQTGRSALRVAQNTNKKQNSLIDISNNIVNKAAEMYMQETKYNVQNKTLDYRTDIEEKILRRLNKLDEENITYTDEEVINIIESFGKETDLDHKTRYKNDKMTYDATTYWKDTAKNKFRDEVYKRRRKYINTQTLIAPYKSLELIKNEFDAQQKTLKANPDAYFIQKNELNRTIGPAMQTGLTPPEIIDIEKELDMSFFTNRAIVKNKDGTINFEKSLEYLRNPENQTIKNTANPKETKTISKDVFEEIEDIFQGGLDDQNKERRNRIESNNIPLYINAFKDLNDPTMNITQRELKEKYTSKIIIDDYADVKLVELLEEEARKDITERRKVLPEKQDLFKYTQAEAEGIVNELITLPSYSDKKLKTMHQKFYLHPDQKEPKSVRELIAEQQLRPEYFDIAFTKMEKYSGAKFDKMHERKNKLLKDLKPLVFGRLNPGYNGKQANERWQDFVRIFDRNYFIALEKGDIPDNKFDITDKDFFVPNVNAYFPSDSQQSSELADFGAENLEMNIIKPTWEGLKEKYDDPDMTLEEAAMTDEMKEYEKLIKQQKELKKRSKEEK